MSKELCTAILKQADVEINGTKAWDIRVSHDAFYATILRYGEVGLGESYVEGWWTCERIDLLIEKLITANLEENIKLTIGQQLKATLSIVQAAGSFLKRTKMPTEIVNQMPKSLLDPYLQMSSGYWRNGATDLNQAQIDKMELICKKLNLKSSAQLLDLGCGDGGFARYAAEKYQVNLVGYNRSIEQTKIAQDLNNTTSISFETGNLEDFSKVLEKYGPFDAISGIELLEYIDAKQYKSIMTNISQCLKEDGVALIQTVTSDKKSTNWIRKYILPSIVVPKLTDLISSMEGMLVIEDIHNIGEDYCKTLIGWYQNLQKNWDQIAVKNPVLYTLTFKRACEYCLLSCAAYFKTRSLQLYQIVMTKIGRAQPMVRYGGVQAIPIDTGDR